MSEKWDKAKQYAAQLAAWDRHIVQIVGIENQADKEKNVDLVCSFEPEPSDDCLGFFWIASLMVRIEYESSDERLDIQEPFDLGFRIGKQVFLPNGQILRTMPDQIPLWPSHDDNVSDGF